MTMRITIVMSEGINRKVRLVQSKLIAETNRSVSFSSVVEMLLKEALAK